MKPRNMRCFTLFHLIMLCLVNCVPLQDAAVYDVDCNGTPDLCYIDGETAHCLLITNTWISFPATSREQCLVTISSSTILSQSSTLTELSPLSSTTIGVATNPTTVPVLPDSSTFSKDKGSKWKIELQGNLTFPGALQDKGLEGDKCRTGKIGDRVIWNCGDMQCGDAWQICGFSMGPAFYGTDSVMEVDTTNVDLLQDNEFIGAWHEDAPPEYPQFIWGMDTSNVAPLNDTHGVAFAWQTWRGSADGAHVDRGNAVAIVTLGQDRPIAERVGPLLTGPEKVALGLLAILRDEEYIYTYSIGGPSNLIVGRVPADDSVFDVNTYEFLLLGKDSWTTEFPNKNTTDIGATTANLNGEFGCSEYGSVYFNTYAQKYIMLCDMYMRYVNMYLSNTPFGPWSEEYHLKQVGEDGLVPNSYGSMAHPEYGNGKEWYFSIGPNSYFQVFKVAFDY